MRKILESVLLAALLAGCSSGDSVDEPQNPPVGDPNDASEWTYTTLIDLTPSESGAIDGINEFSFALMKEMSDASADGEFSVSPVSVAIYLGMLANATSGDVNAQILKTLAATDIETLNSTCEKFMRYLPCDDNGSSISVSNRFWVADFYNVPENFRSIMASSFNAGVESVDFTTPSTVPTINKWVSDNTRGLIPSLLDGDWKDFVSLSMANANAVYFKGQWLNKFDVKNTKTEKFHTPDGDKDILMMHNTLKASYASSDIAEMVRLEFEGPKNDMYIYLPAEGVSVKELIAALTPAMQTDLRKACETCDITLGLPRFEMRSDCDLHTPLSTLGIKALETADFSPMGLGMLPASTVHKTSIKIDEDGAELAALTGGWYGANFGENELKKVTIDFNRPFVYIIRNSDTGAILMAGAVVRP